MPEPEPVPGYPAPAAESAEPTLRVGLAVGAASATIGGGAPLAVRDAAGAKVAEIGAAETWRISAQGVGLQLVGPTGAGAGTGGAVAVAPQESGQPIRVNGREYRGEVEVVPDRTGFTVINRVGLESYVVGVVSAEMGRRAPEDLEALRAQSVVSRTYALRNRGRWRAQGFDLYATVADQVYGGVGAETVEAREAVSGTRGMILTYGGQPIDAFFYSTCGGTTADGTEVFRAADRPYLRSIPDVGADGTAYCSLSPRFRWREEWTGASLQTTLRRTLPPVAGVAASDVGDVRDVWVARRTASGRVGELVVALAGIDARVSGPAVRQVLRPQSGELLRSSAFTLTTTGAGRRVTRLVADGGGAGHGVGFCQWGAVGRSRAGQDYRQIVAAYYPGAQLERLY
ncbi:MAG TPA: SpoIID/LytB domain-containing protein [Gemmatimonadales bacterium]|nr:SpoIID/LytB domain-containing protein [Gemmatimonadales bacterium]